MSGPSIGASTRPAADGHHAPSQPLLADIAHISVLDFADDANIVIPLTDLTEQELAPQTLAVRDAAPTTRLRSTCSLLH